MTIEMKTFEALFQALQLRLGSGDKRHLVAIVGPPAAGKSTLAESLCQRLNESSFSALSAAVVSQDAFHFDNAVLEQRGMSARKGAEDTFDVAGLKSLLERLVADHGEEVAIPVFDRSLELSRNAAAILSPDTRIILVEGNYLLLDQAPWSALRPLFGTTLFLHASLEQLRARLERRWKHLDPVEARAKIDGNDLRNAEVVVLRSRPADLTVNLQDPL